MLLSDGSCIRVFLHCHVDEADESQFAPSSFTMVEFFLHTRMQIPHGSADRRWCACHSRTSQIVSMGVGGPWTFTQVPDDDTPGEFINGYECDMSGNVFWPHAEFPKVLFKNSENEYPFRMVQMNVSHVQQNIACDIMFLVISLAQDRLWCISDALVRFMCIYDLQVFHQGQHRRR